MILFYEKVIHDLDGDHGSEHGTDQIQKIGDIIHGKHHGRRGTYDRNSHSRPLFLDLLGNGHTGYPRGIRVQEGGCHCGKYNDEQARQSQAAPIPMTYIKMLTTPYTAALAAVAANGRSASLV